MSKKVVLSTVLLTLSISLWGQQNRYSVKDSIHMVYDSLFFHLESQYIYKEKVDWKALKSHTKRKALQGNSLKEAFDTTLTELFDTIQGSHLNIFSKQGWYKSSLGKPLEQEDFSKEFLLKYTDKPGFETKTLDNKYGYVLIPGMMLDVSKDSLNRKTQQMYNDIASIAKNQNIEGWIIDLRMNIGGNAIPMIAALHYLLGNHTVYTVRASNNDMIELNVLKDGGYYDDGELLTKAQTSLQPNTNIPVVLITGLMTASAGELIPVSFKGRENVLTIGEETYGMLTGNELTELPFGVKLTLTVGYLCDRKGNYSKSIVPDVPVSKKDNYTDLLKDENVIRAIQYIKATNNE